MKQRYAKFWKVPKNKGENLIPPHKKIRNAICQLKNRFKMLLYYEPKVCSTNVAINFSYSKYKSGFSTDFVSPLLFETGDMLFREYRLIVCMWILVN